MKTAQEVTIKEILEVEKLLRKEAMDFLVSLGGFNTGYETWVKGDIGSSTGLSIRYRKTDVTLDELRDNARVLGRKLTETIVDIFGETAWKELTSLGFGFHFGVKYQENSYGCGDMTCSFGKAR